MFYNKYLYLCSQDSADLEMARRTHNTPLHLQGDNTQPDIYFSQVNMCWVVLIFFRLIFTSSNFIFSLLIIIFNLIKLCYVHY